MKIQRRTSRPWDPIEPTHRGIDEVDEAKTNPMAAQLLGERMAKALLDDNLFRSDSEARLKSACRWVRAEARREITKYSGDSFLRSGQVLVHDSKVPRPIKDAFWNGFDWQIERAFRCACDPSREHKDLDGLRRRGRR